MKNKTNPESNLYTSKLIFEENTDDAIVESSEISICEFDPDFLLSTVFGHQAMLIKTTNGMFHIFEPVKRKSYRNENQFAQNLLNGYKSQSEFSGYEESSEELNGPFMQKNKNSYRSSILSPSGKNGNKITPRAILRK